MPVRLFVLAAFLTSCFAQNVPTIRASTSTSVVSTNPISSSSGSSFVCSICGQGREIGNTLGVVATSNGPVTCGSLQSAANGGLISPSDCTIVQLLSSSTCSCRSKTSTAGAATPSPAPASVCSICGEGKEIGNKGAIVSTDMGMFTCTGLAGAGKNGRIPMSQCNTIQKLAASTCQCKALNATATATSQAAVSSKQNSTNSGPFVCPICGFEGFGITHPLGIVVLPSQPNRTCLEYMQAAQIGAIPQGACGLVQQMAFNSCGCVELATKNVSQNFLCSVCGENKTVTNLTGIVSIPGQPTFECSQLMEAASAGNIGESQCSYLQSFVQNPCGCAALTPAVSQFPSDMPSMFPSSGPSLSPFSPSPTFHETPSLTFEGCFRSLTEIYAIEKDLVSPSILRKYILCPSTTYNIGTVNSTGNIVSGQHPIQLRPNVIYQCGADGNRSNDCHITGGDFGLTSFYGVYDGIYETVENVLIKGLTFESQKLFSVILEAAGNITFEDCAFQVRQMGLRRNVENTKSNNFLTNIFPNGFRILETWSQFLFNGMELDQYHQPIQPLAT